MPERRSYRYFVGDAIGVLAASGLLIHGIKDGFVGNVALGSVGVALCLTDAAERVLKGEGFIEETGNKRRRQ